MNDTEQNAARGRLTAERDRLEAQLRAESADEAARRDVTAEEGTAGEDTADAGADLARTAEGEQAVATLREQLRAVEEAEDRLARGEYGRCTVCGKEIDDERLAARPAATTCRDHAD